MNNCVAVVKDYTLAMDVSISMIDDDDELDTILENTNLDEFELNDSPRE